MAKRRWFITSCLVVALSLLGVFLVGATPASDVHWSNVHVLFTQTTYNAANEPVTQSMELWWKSSNVWCLTNLDTKAFVVADGHSMYKRLQDRESGAPLNPSSNMAPNAQYADSHIVWVLVQGQKVGTDVINDQPVDIYQYVASDNSRVAKYWIDRSADRFPLKVEEYQDGKVILSMVVTKMEHQSATESVFQLPTGIPIDRVWGRKFDTK